MKRIKEWYWGIIDLTEKISDKSRARKCFEITLGSLPWCWIDSKQKRLTVSSDPDSILNDAVNSECKYCLLQASGHFVNFYFYELLFNEVEKEEFLVKGHILDKTQPRFSSYERRWYCLDNQCIVVNLEVYRRLKNPQFITLKTDLVDPVRSEENFHDDYTPFWLSPSENRIQASLPEFGGGLIEASLENRLTVLNFSHNIRAEKFHLYPEYDTYYYDALHRLEELNRTRYKKEIYFWNTEQQFDYKIESNESISTIYCSASGFIPFKIAQENIVDEETMFVHYDISPAALHFREHQINHWNGTDFIRFSTEYLASNESFGYSTGPGLDEKRWQNELANFGGEKSWLELWYKIKKCRHIFKLVDITKEIEQVIIPGKNSIFWITNCFSYHHACKDGITERSDQYLKFIRTLQVNNIGWIFGYDYFGKPIAGSIKEYSSPNYIKEYELETYLS